MSIKPPFWDLFYIYPKILIPCGIICNILNLILFSTKKLSKISVSLLIKVISVNNMINLLVFGFWQFEGPYKQNLWDLSIFLCKVVVINSYIYNGINAWILVYISLDRLIMIIVPQKPKVLESKNFQIVVCLTIYIINILIFLPSIFFYDLNESTDWYMLNKTICEVKDSSLYKTEAYTELFNSIVLPFIFMFFLSILIIISLKKSKNKVFNRSESVKRPKNKSFKFSITILTSNFVFLVLNLPMSIGYILDDDVLKTFGNFLMATFFSIDFFIYFATNSLVREKFFQLFCSNFKRFQKKTS